MSDPENAYVNDEAAAAVPGTRVNIGSEDLPSMATATDHYMAAHGCLFRRFAWCEHEILSPNDRTAAGMWLSVRAHWKQFKKNSRRA